jgi:hypothetical protein
MLAPQPVGIANTTNKYSETRPVRAHVTPFEKRVEAKIHEEELAAAQLALITSDTKSVVDVGT